MNAARLSEATRHEDRPGREHRVSTVIGPRQVRHVTGDWRLAGLMARAVIEGCPR